MNYFKSVDIIKKIVCGRNEFVIYIRFYTE